MTIQEIQELRAKRLSIAIKKSGLSYPELEKLTGIPKSSLQRYATGATKKIPIDYMEKIADVLNIDSKYLTFGKNNVLSEGVEENEQPTPADDSRSELYDDLNKLSDSELSKVEGFVKGLLAQGDSDK